MTDRELMQMALDALINAKGYIFYNVLDDKGNRYDTAIEALRARLEQPEPEVGVCCQEFDKCLRSCTPRGQWIAHKAAQREWQGLTDEDCEEVERWVEFKEEGSGRIPTLKLIRYIEAKLKEKNT